MTYKCATCRKTFPRYEAVTTKGDLFTYHPDSLVHHFIHSEPCNRDNAERRKADREERRAQEHAELMDAYG